MMHHHLSRLLKHRLLSPAAFSTSSRRTPARRTTKSPADAPAKKAGDDAAAPAAVAGDAAAAATTSKMEKVPGALPRPSTIPFQPRVANAVHLVGTVGAPVQVQRTPDGRFSAVSVLVQDHRVDFPKFWIPIIFQDDLAQVAASHLKENDLVSVSGQLTGDVPPLKLADGQANIQVLANVLQFVDSKAVVADFRMVEEEEGFKEVVEYKKKFEAKQFGPTYPPCTVSGYRSKADKLNKLWDDLLATPQDWTDNRPLKQNGSKSVKYPDFTNKVSKEGLWLNTASQALLEKLDGLVFDKGYDAGRRNIPFGDDTGKGFNTNWTARKSQDTSASSKQKIEGDLWQDLLKNPAKWWDNRLGKLNPKQPDFKNSESGKALWINTNSPQWAIDALPSLKFKGASKGTRSQETLLS